MHGITREGKRLALVLRCSASFVVVFDIGVVTVALPSDWA